MLNSYWLTEIVLLAIEGVINVVLRAAGGPDHVPQTNEDLVWY